MCRAGGGRTKLPDLVFCISVMKLVAVETMRPGSDDPDQFQRKINEMLHLVGPGHAMA